MSLDLSLPSAARPDGTYSTDAVLDDPPNNNALALGVLIVCFVVPTAAVFIRLYEKTWLTRKFKVEEALTLFAYACFIVASASTFKLVETPGYFVHTWDIRLRDLAPTAMWILVDGTAYAIVMPVIKTAILLEWCTMFAPAGRNWFWWGSMALIAIQVTGGIVFVSLLHARCTPHRANYDPIAALLPTSRCAFQLQACQLGSGILQLVTDVCMFLLPQPVIWGLNMNWRKRAGVSVIFAAGVIACVSAAVRLYETVAYVNSTDAMYLMASPLFWVAAEMACGFIIVAVPCMPKFVRETGLLAGFRRVFGLPSTAAPTSKGPTYGGSKMTGNGGSSNVHQHHGGSVSMMGSKASHLGNTTTSSRAYYQIDEDGVPLDELKTDSTERLRHDAPSPHEVHNRVVVGGRQQQHAQAKSGGGGGNGIVRTTRVAVTQAPVEFSDSSSHESPHDTAVWNRRD